MLAISALGFSEAEAAVYVLLAGKGESTVGPLIAETGLHRNVVYTALEHLGRQKLVTERLVKGKKTFVVSNPDVFAEEMSERAKLAREVATEVVALSTRVAQDISVHSGNDEYLTLLTSCLRALPRGATKYVLGTGGEAFMRETMRPIWRKYHEVAKEQGIAIKMLAYESQRSSLEEVLKEGIYEIRYLPDNIENPSGVHIYPEAGTVLNILYSDETEPVTAIRIRDERLVKGQLNLFRHLWKIAKT